jgi:hypothetical protein
VKASLDNTFDNLLPPTPVRTRSSPAWNCIPGLSVSLNPANSEDLHLEASRRAAWLARRSTFDSPTAFLAPAAAELDRLISTAVFTYSGIGLARTKSLSSTLFPPSRKGNVDRQPKELMKELCKAIKESLSDSKRVAEVVSRIEKEHSLDIGVVINAKIGVSKQAHQLPINEPPRSPLLEVVHVRVRPTRPGDILEYSLRWQREKPLAKGQFWFGYQFVKSAVILDEQLEISVPREREIKLKSQTIQPTTHEENGRSIYRWKTSSLEIDSAEKQKESQGYDAIRGVLPPPDVLISSFRTWEEVGRWYEGLQQEKIQPSPEVKAKAEELTKGTFADKDAPSRRVTQYFEMFGNRAL